MKLSIVIPCYNESGNIPFICDRLLHVLADKKNIEIILVNNGSQDNSREVFGDEMARLSDVRFRIVDVPVNKGYGHGILQGLAASTGDILAWMHADMQTDSEDVLRALDLWQTMPPGHFIIKGKRQNRALLETFFTFGMQLIASAALGTALDDINAQPKMFSRFFYETLLKPSAPLDFSLDLYLLYQARAHAYRIISIPVIFHKRLHGEAKGGGNWKTRIKLIKRTFAYIFELRLALKKETS